MGEAIAVNGSGSPPSMQIVFSAIGKQKERDSSSSRGRRVLTGRSGRAPWRAPSPSTQTKPLKELSYLRRPLQPLLAPPQGLRTPHFISKASQNIA